MGDVREDLTNWAMHYSISPQAFDALLSALSARAAVPEGYFVAPIVPSEAMRMAGTAGTCPSETWACMVQQAMAESQFAAQLAAAPQPAGEALKWTNPAPHASAPGEPTRNAMVAVESGGCAPPIITPAPSSPADLPADLAAAVADDDAAWRLARLAVECGAEDNATDGQPQTWTLGVAAFTELARRLSSPAAVPQAPADVQALQALVAEWRTRHPADCPTTERIGMREFCADQLDAVIRRLSGAQQAAKDGA